MKIVNRGYLIVRPLQPFIEWALDQDEETFMDENVEASIYLVEEDFFEDEPVIEANFKKIFLNELEAVTDDESKYPPIRMELFKEWFKVEAGNNVFDGEKSDLLAD
jgi:hypothetical protein